RELSQKFPEHVGEAVRVQTFITDAPGGTVSYYGVLENGKIVESKLGEDANADFAVTSSYADSLKMAKGEIEAGEALAEGRLHVTGDLAKFLAFLPIAIRPEYRKGARELDKLTDYPAGGQPPKKKGTPKPN